VHIFCPQTTQELPKKHHKAGPPEQLPILIHGHKLIKDILDSVKSASFPGLGEKPGDEVDCEDWRDICLCQRTTQKSENENLSRGMRMAEFQNISPPPLPLDHF